MVMHKSKYYSYVIYRCPKLKRNTYFDQMLSKRLNSLGVPLIGPVCRKGSNSYLSLGIAPISFTMQVTLVLVVAWYKEHLIGLID